MKYSALNDFIDQLTAEAKLCVMPVPRLLIEDKIDTLDGFAFYSASKLNLEELRIAWSPAEGYAKTIKKGNGIISAEGNDLEWLKSATTRLSTEDFNQHTLIVFIQPVNWEYFLTGNHAYHCELLKEASERAETAMDILRLDFCRLHLPDALPGRAGTFGTYTPYSGALFYTLADNESYITGGQIITHQLVVGLGLEISCIPSTDRIGSDEPGNVARRGLNMFSAAMESNSLTSKFVQCMSLLDFLAFPDDYRPMKRVKREIAAHAANTQSEYQTILDEIERLTSFKDKGGVQIGLRTLVVHQGKRFEELVPSKRAQKKIFKRLERYITKTLHDLIDLSDQPWQAVECFRNDRKP